MPGEFQSDYKRRGRRWAGTADIPPLPSGALILEAGCGNGKTLAGLADFKTIGVDISPEAVRLSACATAVAGDVCALPFADAVFDAVLCLHLLGHLRAADRKKAADELIRVVKPTGTIYFRDFSVDDFRCGTGTEVEPDSYLRGDGLMTHYFTEPEVTSLFGHGRLSRTAWTLRVRGVIYPRSEINGVFERPKS